MDKFDLRKAVEAEGRRRQMDEAERRHVLDERRAAVTALRDRLFHDEAFASENGLSANIENAALVVKHEKFSITAKWMGDHFLLEFIKARRSGVISAAAAIGYDEREDAVDVDHATKWIGQQIYDFVK